MKRHAPALSLVTLVGLLLLVLANLAAYKPTNQKSNCYRFNATRTTVTGATEYLSADSGDVVYAYPAQSDTAGLGQRVAYLGGARRLWSFCPDSTEVWNFYETVGYDTLLQGLDSVLVATPVASESLITRAADIKNLVIDSAHLASSSVITAKIAASAVDSSKLAALSVRTSDIGALQVTGAKLAAGAVSDSTKFGSAVIPLAAFKTNARGRIVIPQTMDLLAAGGDTLVASYIIPPDSTTGVTIMSGGTHSNRGMLIASGLGLSSTGSSGVLTRSAITTSYLTATTNSLFLKVPNLAWNIMKFWPDSTAFYDPNGDNAFTIMPDSVRFYKPVRFRAGHK